MVTSSSFSSSATARPGLSGRSSATLRQEIYLFQQDMTLPECFFQRFYRRFGFLLFPLLLREGVLFAADD
jgi:hypothetical protein